MTHEKTTIFYDGACSLCRKEISLLRKWDKRERIEFLDISPPDAAAFCPLPQGDMLARFHVRRGDGVIIDGAEAFTHAYAQIPGLSWVGAIGRFRPSRWLLNVAYAGFLKIRPSIQKMVNKKAAP